MKKLLLAAVCFGMFTVANAESDYSPEKGDFAVEFGFTPFKSNGSTFQLNEGMLKARYFISDKNAIRLKLGLGIDNNTRTSSDSYHPADTKGVTVYDITTDVKTKNTSFSILVGYERHLFTKGRFDVYAGIELGYMMNKQNGSWCMKYEGTTFGSDNAITGVTTCNVCADFTNAYDAGSSFTVAGTLPSFTPNYVSANANHNFVGNLFAGVDFYVYKQLYLGAELGLNFKTGKTPNSYASYDIDANNKNYTGTTVKETIYTAKFNEDAGTSTQKLTVDGKLDTVYDGEPKYGPQRSNKTTYTSFNFFVEPAVRIGWRF